MGTQAGTMLVLLFASLCLAAARPQPRPVDPPQWPSRFTATYTLSLPHLYLTQPGGLKFPVTVWYDADEKKQRTDMFGGADSSYTLGAAEYTIFPRIDKLHCAAFVPGPVADAAGLQKPPDDEPLVNPLLPDLSTWTYAGQAQLDGASVNMWQSQLKQGDKVSQYTFYATADGVPLKFHMFGINWLTNSHFDEYLYDITSFQPSIDDDGVFDLPSVCKDEATLSHISYRHPVAQQHTALLPDAAKRRPYDHNRVYHIWSRAYGRMHDSAEELQQRSTRFFDVARRMHAHNSDVEARRDAARARAGAAAGGSDEGDDGSSTPMFTMRLNRFADWSNDEFVRTMLPKRWLRDRAQAPLSKMKDAYKPLYHFKGTKHKSQLPRSVDWRGTGADPGMKDQATCGSCFAFAATAAMEGSWYLATGEHRSFSEQQVIDCSWEWGPNGCSGGDYEPVFNYVAHSGGIALEQDYPYLGANDWCRADNHTRVGKFKGFIEIETRDETTLMEAVHKFGPIAVAVDAEAESFRYYSEGVYYQADCRTKASELDHAVVLFGYGTTDDGEDYWLVKNTWAKFYGDDGFLKLPRGRHDCGISSDPTVAVVADEYVVEGMREAAMAEATRAR